MNAEEHMKAFEQHRKTLFRWAMDISGLANSQRTVGLTASRAIIELLSVLLHKMSKIDSGFQINHTWFKSMSVSGRLPDFHNKEKTVAMMVKLELLCENLTYGSPRPIEETEKAVEMFKELENMIFAEMPENER